MAKIKFKRGGTSRTYNLKDSANKPSKPRLHILSKSRNIDCYLPLREGISQTINIGKGSKNYTLDNSDKNAFLFLCPNSTSLSGFTQVNPWGDKSAHWVGYKPYNGDTSWYPREYGDHAWHHDATFANGHQFTSSVNDMQNYTTIAAGVDFTGTGGIYIADGNVSHYHFGNMYYSYEVIHSMSDADRNYHNGFPPLNAGYSIFVKEYRSSNKGYIPKGIFIFSKKSLDLTIEYSNLKKESYSGGIMAVTDTSKGYDLCKVKGSISRRNISSHNFPIGYLTAFSFEFQDIVVGHTHTEDTIASNSSSYGVPRGGLPQTEDFNIYSIQEDTSFDKLPVGTCMPVLPGSELPIGWKFLTSSDNLHSGCLMNVPASKHDIFITTTNPIMGSYVPTDVRASWIGLSGYVVQYWPTKGGHDHEIPGTYSFGVTNDIIQCRELDYCFAVKEI